MMLYGLIKFIIKLHIEPLPKMLRTSCKTHNKVFIHKKNAVILITYNKNETFHKTQKRKDVNRSSKYPNLQRNSPKVLITSISLIYR
jgi:hypothetical protein